MKKYIIKISLVFIGIAVVVLVFLGLRLRREGGASYRFLAGREPITGEKANRRSEDSRGLLDRRYIYSFEADFNDFCTKADAELIPAGFSSNSRVFKNLSGDNSPYRIYRIYDLKERFPRGPVWIVIYNDIQCVKFPNSEHNGLSEKDGWVMVEVVYGRGWRWPF
ncbi:MAG TPA: hypothetical protein DIU00_20285 [Phycisphaerales bacterium]|nr:hypothetical protein [Phycisphaerales bacterium]